MYCGKCGAFNNDNDKFCGSCGAELKPDDNSCKLQKTKDYKDKIPDSKSEKIFSEQDSPAQFKKHNVILICLTIIIIAGGIITGG